MNEEIIDHINKYIRWNNALISYFFRDQNDDEVFLYVTPDTINEIGNVNNIGSYDDFMKVVLVVPNKRPSFWGSFWNTYIGGKQTTSCSRKCRTSIFAFAGLFSCQPVLGCNLKCPYFNFIILSLLLAENATRNNNPIGDFIKSFLKDYFGGEQETGNYSELENLFNTLHKEFPSFRNYISTKHRYVGLLKYQLILSSTQLDSLYSVLYNLRFEYNDDISYERNLIRIYDYVEDDLKQLISESVKNGNEFYQNRIEDALRKFDLEEYEAGQQEQGDKIYGTFIHALYFGQIIKIVMLTDVRESDVFDGQQNLFVPAELYDSLSGYNVNHLRKENSDVFSLNECPYVDNNDFNIKTIKSDGIIFLQRYNDTYYLETRSLVDTETYIAVSNDCKNLEKWKNFATEYCPNYEQIPSERTIDILGNGWLLFYTSSISGQYYKDELIPSQSNNLGCRIEMKGGIVPKQKNNVYLAIALPYFVFPEDIHREKLKVNVKIDSVPLESDDYKLTTSKEKLFIDILEYTKLKSVVSVRMDIDIKYTGIDNCRYDLLKSIYVVYQDVEYSLDCLYKYDKWGRAIENESTNPYLRGNQIINVSHPWNGNSSSIAYNYRTFESEDIKYFYFINLLSAVCFKEESSSISRNTLRRCIHFVSVKLGVDYSANSNYVRGIIYDLVSSGYFNAKYSNVTTYQAIPPTFVKVPPFKGLTSRNGKCLYNYLLTGCFTLKFLLDLYTYCTNHSVGIYIQNKQTPVNGTITCMPPLIVLGTSFDSSSFQNDYRHMFETCNSDLSSDLLEFLPDLQTYIDTLKEIPRGNFNASLVPIKENAMFPRVRQSLSKSYCHSFWIEKSDGRFWRSDILDSKWMNLYCLREQGLRSCLLDDQANEIYLDVNCHLPDLLNRYLFFANMGHPLLKKIFICNDTNSSYELYRRMYVYKLQGVLLNEDLKSLFENFFVRELLDVSNTNYCSKYKICLWTEKNRLNNKKNYILTLHYCHGYLLGKEKSAVSIAFLRPTHESSCDVYVKNGTCFKKTQGRVNEIFSKLILSERYSTFNDLGIILEEETVTFPEEESYNIEEIEIK